MTIEIEKMIYVSTKFVNKFASMKINDTLEVWMLQFTKKKFNSLDIREKIRHDAVEQFEIIHQEFGNIDISDSTQSYKFL